MPNIEKETHFVMRNGKAEYPSVAKENLLVWYDAKGKHNPDRHKDTLLDLSGNNRHAQLYNFAYEKKSGYLDNPEGGLLFDDVDDKLVYPSVKDEVAYTSASRNQLPPFSSGLWTLSGGATISGNTLTIPREGAFATIDMPWDRSDTKIRVSALYSAPPLVNIRYLDNEGNQIGTNGWANASVVPTDRAYGVLPYNESQADLTKTKTIRVSLTTGSATPPPYTVIDMMITANSHGNIPYTPYVPLPIMTYQYNGNILSYEADGTVKRVDDGKVITRKGINLVRNGNAYKGTSGFGQHQAINLRSSDYGVSATGDGTSSSASIVSTSFAIEGEQLYKAGDVFYMSGEVAIWSAGDAEEIGDVQIQFRTNRGLRAGNRITLPELGVWHKMSGIFEIGEQDLGFTNPYIRIQTSQYKNPINKNIELSVNNFQLINLTEAYSIGNEPTLDYIQAHPEEFAWTPNPNDLIEAHEIKNNLVGDLEDLHGTGDKTEILSGVGEVFTDKAEDDSIVHVELEGKSVQPHRFREESGESLVLTNHAEDSPRKLEVLGNTFQNAGSGKNLAVAANTDNWSYYGTNSTTAITTFDSLGNYTVKSTKIGSNAVVFGAEQSIGHRKIRLNAGSTYNISFDIRGDINKLDYVYIMNQGASNQGLGDFSLTGINPTAFIRVNKTFTKSPATVEFSHIMISTRPANGTWLEFKNVQLEEGSVATPYEPPAPSPDYPIEMKSLGEELELYSGSAGRNLFSITKLKDIPKITKTINSLILTNTYGNPMGDVPFKLIPNTTYTINYSVEIISGEVGNKAAIGRISLRDNRRALWYHLGVGGIIGDVSNTFTTPSDISEYTELYLYGLSGVTVELKNLKLEEGTTTPCTPAPEDVPLNTIQNGVFRTKPNLTAPLRKVGDVADRLFWDATAGKWKVERRVGEIEIVTKGHSWTWLKAISSNPDYYYFYRTQDSLGMTGGRRRIYSGISPLKSNRLRVLSPRPYASVSEEAIVPWSDLTPFIFVLHKTRLGELTDANINAWFESNPTTILYQLQTPVIETLEGGQLPPLFSPTTHLDTISEVKGQLTAGYRLKEGVVPEDSDILVAPEYVNPIHSINEVDVVSSVGRRNLILKSSRTAEKGKIEYLSVDDKSIKTNQRITLSVYVEVVNGLPKSQSRLGMEFPITYEDGSTGYHGVWHQLDTAKTFKGRISYSFTTKNIPIKSAKSANLYASLIDGDVVKVSNPKIEISNGNVTPYSPAPEEIQPDTYTLVLYKTNILLSEPLRSVGDVKDRLFRDSDGLWKVEVNVGEETISDNTGLGNYASKNGFGQVFSGFSRGLRYSLLRCDKLDILDGTSWNNGLKEGIFIAGSGNIALALNENRLISKNSNGINEWLAKNNLRIQYALSVPVIKTLSQADQDKLNNISTYAGSNYIYTVFPDKDASLAEQLQPMIHAKFRKLSWFWSRLLFNQLKIWKRNLTDSELLHEWKQNKKRWGM